MAIDFGAILDFANKLTIIGLLTVDLVVLVVALQRRWVVLGWVYQEKVTSEQAWREVALRNAGIAARSVGVAETVLPAVIKSDVAGA